MIVAALLTVVGFFGTAYVTQTRGLRIGGTILVPTLAVYALKDFITVPVFLLSTVVGYALLWAAKEYTLVYGRDEFLVALAAGALLPVVGFLVLRVVAPGVVETHPIVFVGSILPGLAAFNLHQTKPEYRRQDLRYTAAVTVGLILLGSLLITPRIGRLVGDLTPLVLFAETSDIALLRGAVVDGFLASNVDARTTIVAVLLVSMVLGEVVRRRFGIRLGIISLGLLALFSLASRWLLVLFALSFVVAYGGIWVVHRTSLLYGRVLISIGCGIGTLAAVLLAIPLPIIRGFSALFIGVIAGVDAYNVHATPALERRQQLPLSIAVFTGMLVVARLVVTPFERGVLQTFGPVHIGVAAVVIVGCLAVARWLSVERPDDETVLSASVLSGGDGA